MSDVTRSMKEGLGYGLIAGVVFAAVQLLAAAATGVPPALPFRLAASVLLGPQALAVTPHVTAIVVGGIAHLFLSALFGLFYGTYNSALTPPTRSARGWQALLGMLFGAMLWLVNFRLIALVHFPWFLEVPQGPQLVIHVLGFGLPLGVLYGTAEARVRRAPRLSYR